MQSLVQVHGECHHEVPTPRIGGFFKPHLPKKFQQNLKWKQLQNITKIQFFSPHLFLKRSVDFRSCSRKLEVVPKNDATNLCLILSVFLFYLLSKFYCVILWSISSTHGVSKMYFLSKNLYVFSTATDVPKTKSYRAD